ncbi:MAG TPA: hypothetical protein VJ853_15240 [Thermoanaerobaculia bacterium]|nr:hypothetical protein [Thermoanaerobaculia bacterium]
MIEALESEARESQPGRTHLRALTHCKIQPAYRKEICRRAEVEVNVDAAVHIATRRTVQLPRGTINLYDRLDAPGAHPSGYARSDGHPGQIAGH